MRCFQTNMYIVLHFFKHSYQGVSALKFPENEHMLCSHDPVSKICYYPHVLSSWARPEDCKEWWPASSLEDLAFNSLPQTERVKAAFFVGGVLFVFLVLCNQDITK